MLRLSELLGATVLGGLGEGSTRLMIVLRLALENLCYDRMAFRLRTWPAAIIKQMQKLQSQSTSNPTSIIQKAAVAALRESQACVAEMREDYIRLREQDR